MKNFRKIGLLLLALLLIIPFADVDAQKRRRKKQEESKSISSFIDVYGGGGYSSLLHNVEGSSIPGGGAGMLGIGYFMKHKSNFNFRAGLEFMYLNSTTRMDDFSYSGDFFYSDANKKDYLMKLAMAYSDYRESQNRLSLNIPIMFGSQFNQIYFLVGAKAGIKMMGNYAMHADLTTTLEDPELIDVMGNMSTHALGTMEAKYKNKLDLGFDVAVSAEIGLSLDKYFPASALEYGSGSNKRAVSYRVGAFVDYGVMNINNNEPKEILAHYPGLEPLGDGKYSVPFNNLSTIQNNSVVSLKNSETGKVSALNSLVVGAKFTVLLGVDKAPKPQPKRKLRRPKIRDISYIPDPTYFYLFVNDYETQEPLDAIVKVYNLGENTDTIFAGVTDKETGFVEEQIDNGMYGLFVSRPGYIDFNDTLFNVISDTLYVDLQPIKKNTVVILRNLLFDTDKTTIRNISAPSLEELYQLMAQNPNMRIRITGHTDNVGSERYNKKLSEGRAKAVYDEMVKRGIDPSRMEWNGRGSKEPIESNKTAEGRAENRRVEFTILSE